MFQKYVSQKRRGDDHRHMQLALESAEAAKSQGDMARGAVLVFPNRVIAESQTVVNESDPTAHAEMNVIRKAAQTHRRALKEAVLYVTSEPCCMCAAAALNCGIREIIFGAYDSVSGFQTTKRLNLEGVELKCLGGVMAEDCYAIASPSLRECLKVTLDETPPTGNS